MKSQVAVSDTSVHNNQCSRGPDIAKVVLRLCDEQCSVACKTDVHPGQLCRLSTHQQLVYMSALFLSKQSKSDITHRLEVWALQLHSPGVHYPDASSQVQKRGQVLIIGSEMYSIPIKPFKEGTRCKENMQGCTQSQKEYMQG